MPNSGVVLTAEFLGTTIERDDESTDGTLFTAVLLAHEAGHYLGLFHTTEQSVDQWDPIEDTEECRVGFPAGCPDVSNVMFPFADVNHTELTEGQGAVLGANPLTTD